jgi:hypothetical protein
MERRNARSCQAWGIASTSTSGIRAENSHQPTRLREKTMRQFKSAKQAQRFLSAFGPITGHFQPRRHRLRAGEYRPILQDRFLIHCPPERVRFPVDLQVHFIHIPFVTAVRTATTQCIGVGLSKCEAPFSDCFLCYYGTGEQTFVTQSHSQCGCSGSFSQSLYCLLQPNGQTNQLDLHSREA